MKNHFGELRQDANLARNWDEADHVASRLRKKWTMLYLRKLGSYNNRIVIRQAIISDLEYRIILELESVASRP